MQIPPQVALLLFASAPPSLHPEAVLAKRYTGYGKTESYASVLRLISTPTVLAKKMVETLYIYPSYINYNLIGLFFYIDNP